MISYILMVYNEEKYVVDAIQSIIKQGNDIEIIVVDDGSRDSTPTKLLERYSDNKYVKLVLSDHIGKNAAANLGVSLAKGDWICLVAGDDLLADNAKDKVLAAVSGVDPNSERVAVFSSLQMISDNKKYNGIRIPKNPNRVNRTGSYAYMSIALVHDMFPLPSSFPNEDTWMGLYYRYFLESSIEIHDILAFYRIHSTNSISKDANFDMYNEYYHSRRIIIEPFIERYHERLNGNEIEKLRRDLRNEELRYMGNTLKLIASKNGSLIEYIRLIVFSNKYLYGIKTFLNRYMLGH